MALPVKFWLDSVGLDSKFFSHETVECIERLLLRLLQEFLVEYTQNRSKSVSEEGKPQQDTELSETDLLKSVWQKIKRTNESPPWSGNFADFLKATSCEDAGLRSPQLKSLNNLILDNLEKHLIS